MVELEQPLKKSSMVIIKGKTTREFELEVKEIRDYDDKKISLGEAGQLVTIPVTKKVRKNDKIVIIN